MPESPPAYDRKTMLDWIGLIHSQGIRRPGSTADQWAERFCVERFRGFGLENVRLEPFECPYWEPRSASLAVEAEGEKFEIPCFALPFSLPTEGVKAELALYGPGAKEKARGKAALYPVTTLRVPPDFIVAKRLHDARQADGAPAGAVEAKFRHDPRRTFEKAIQVLPFGREISKVMEPAIEAGATAFIGELRGYPGGGCEYYVPYDGEFRPIPGVWIGERDGARLREWLKGGTVKVEMRVDAERTRRIVNNVVGELAGASEEMVVIGTHHDGPWASAVEDASGMALVMAQAAHWAHVPPAERPHRLVFLVNGGHMSGGAGVHAFIERHRKELERVVVEIHFEHAAREFAMRDGSLAATGGAGAEVVVHEQDSGARGGGLGGDRRRGAGAVAAGGARCAGAVSDDGRGAVPRGGGAVGEPAGGAVLSF